MSKSKKRTFCSSDRQERENPSQRNTPLVTEECEGQVTVTDPSHPLYRRVLKLAGLASLPGHIRYCQVEILPDRYGYVPLSCTDLSTKPRPEPTLLTVTALSVFGLTAYFLSLTFWLR